jgi:hypothetical protein
VDNSLARVLAHTHRTTTAALSLRISMVDPFQTSFDFKMLAMFMEGDLHKSGWLDAPACTTFIHLVERYETLDLDRLGTRSVVLRHLRHTLFIFITISD